MMPHLVPYRLMILLTGRRSHSFSRWFLEEQYFQIERIDGTAAYLKEINLLDHREDMDLSSSQELNFENAEIIDGEGGDITGNIFYKSFDNDVYETSSKNVSYW